MSYHGLLEADKLCDISYMLWIPTEPYRRFRDCSHAPVAALKSTLPLLYACGSASRQSFTHAPPTKAAARFCIPCRCIVIYAHYAHEASYLPVSSFGLLENVRE